MGQVDESTTRPDGDMDQTYVHGGLFRPMTRAAMIAQDMSGSIKIETLNRTSAVFQFLLDDAFTKYRAIASDPSS